MSLRHRDKPVTFRLDTGDVVERESLFRRLFRRRRRALFSRYITAGGTRETRRDSVAELRERSYGRLLYALSALAVIWLLFHLL